MSGPSGSCLASHWSMLTLQPSDWSVMGWLWLLVTHHLLTHNLCHITVYLQIALSYSVSDHSEHPLSESQQPARDIISLLSVFKIVLNRRRDFFWTTPRSSNKSQPTLTSAFCLLTVSTPLQLSIPIAIYGSDSRLTLAYVTQIWRPYPVSVVFTNLSNYHSLDY